MSPINFNLKPFNTFGIDALALHFDVVKSVGDLLDVLDNGATDFLVLGGGSNMLIKEDINHVVKNEIFSKTIYRQNENYTIVKFGGGEAWHECVKWTLEKGYGGIENLALIPGTMGAAPIQNIGAYGVELKDTFYKLEAVERSTKKIKTFYTSDCHFGYRDSVFKRQFKDQYVITYVYLKFDNNHKPNTSYGAIQDMLSALEIQIPNIKDVAEAVISIRSAKLPDPKVLGNSGSFFKNPVISPQAFDKLLNAFPDAKYYALPDGQYKIPAAWLIEQCGWKGKIVGNVGCYKNQPLVLVNYGGATGEELWQHAQNVQGSVLQKFGINIHPEVNIIKN